MMAGLRQKSLWGCVTTAMWKEESDEVCWVNVDHEKMIEKMNSLWAEWLLVKKKMLVCWCFQSDEN